MKNLFLVLMAVLGTTISLCAQHQIGEIYNQNGLKGIVVDVDASGNHGLILSLQESEADWLGDMSLEMETNAFFEDDGSKNMEIVGRYIAENNLSWEKFPIFAWARTLGEGWYIPAKDELITIWTNLNGGNLNVNKKAQKIWKEREKLMDKIDGDSFCTKNFSSGGFKMLTGLISSTEAEGGKVFCMCAEPGKNLINHPMGAPNVKIIEYMLGKKDHSAGNAMTRNLRFAARAIHKF